MRLRVLPVLLLVCGCGGSAAPPASVVIPVAEPVTTAAAVPSAAPSSSAAAIGRELAELDRAAVSALNAPRGPAKPGEIPVGLLDGSAPAGGSGVAGLRLGSGGGGAVQPGSPAGGGLAGIG